MYPQDVQDSARRNQLMLMLAQAFGAPQGQFGTGLLEGSYLGQQEYQRTLQTFMEQQQKEQQAELQRRQAEALIAQRQSMERYNEARTAAASRPPAPRPPPTINAGGVPHLWNEDFSGVSPIPGIQTPSPAPRNPVTRNAPNGAVMQFDPATGSWGPAPGMPPPVPAAPRPVEPPGPMDDPLYKTAVAQAAIIVRAGEMDPAQIGPIANKIYQSLKAGAAGRDAPPSIEWTPVASPGPRDQELMESGGELPPGRPPQVAPTALYGLSGLAAPKPPPPPPPPSIEGRGTGGDGSVRLQQLLAEHPEINRAEIEKARKDGMSDEAISDLIEAQLGQEGEPRRTTMSLSPDLSRLGGR